MALETIPNEGTVLAISIASVFTDIGQVEEIGSFGVEVAEVETTHLTTTTHTYRPSRKPNPVKFTFTYQCTPSHTATHGLIQNRLNTPGTIDQFKVTFQDSFTTHGFVTFSGFFTRNATTGITDEENLTYEAEVQMTTIPTYTAGVNS
jgi:hypothetical protein